MDEFYNKHYISVDDNDRITDGWSDGPHPNRDTSGAICINEKCGYQFRFFLGGEENPSLLDMDGIPRYRWDGSAAVERSDEELEEDRKAREPVLTPAQQREQAYNTQPIVEWDGQLLTVTEAAQQWAYYSAEGATGKTLELTSLISQAKRTIREQYPDEEAN
ncbi:MAG: hypothetical protein Q4P84_08210 [Elusimicrobiales bacterium]|nr:hypothetical protein [Elusimicrobiales bacterium]